MKFFSEEVFAEAFESGWEAYNSALSEGLGKHAAAREGDLAAAQVLDVPVDDVHKILRPGMGR
jgi:hypothetical protein